MFNIPRLLVRWCRYLPFFFSSCLFTMLFISAKFNPNYSTKRPPHMSPHFSNYSSSSLLWKKMICQHTVLYLQNDSLCKHRTHTYTCNSRLKWMTTNYFRRHRLRFFMTNVCGQIMTWSLWGHFTNLLYDFMRENVNEFDTS